MNRNAIIICVGFFSSVSSLRAVYTQVHLNDAGTKWREWRLHISVFIVFWFIFFFFWLAAHSRKTFTSHYIHFKGLNLAEQVFVSPSSILLDVDDDDDCVNNLASARLTRVRIISSTSCSMSDRSAAMSSTYIMATIETAQELARHDTVVVTFPRLRANKHGLCRGLLQARNGEMVQFDRHEVDAFEIFESSPHTFTPFAVPKSIWNFLFGERLLQPDLSRAHTEMHNSVHVIQNWFALNSESNVHCYPRKCVCVCVFARERDRERAPHLQTNAWVLPLCHCSRRLSITRNASYTNFVCWK